ncbi:hypothetical protein AWB66_00427 [Caballeronia telluris]|uniref:Uncharacterized protein n=1 Tax=Caballeronia telluris TaxID=326475 RepID=A0A158EZZ2_9BURK|nr:hypothetical protein AWB66_00427 [Caballeronia telluris]
MFLGCHSMDSNTSCSPKRSGADRDAAVLSLVRKLNVGFGRLPARCEQAFFAALAQTIDQPLTYRAALVP